MTEKPDDIATPITDALFDRQGYRESEATMSKTAHLLAALAEIERDTAEHPLYLGDEATEEDMIREGGDAASITQWHHIARAAIAAAKGEA